MASTLAKLNDISRRLEKILLDLRAAQAADSQLRELAGELCDAVNAAPEVAIASVLLNQIGGIYSVRHCVETAIVTVIVGRAMGKPASEILTIAGAAMTMNVGMLRHHERFQSTDALSPEDRALVRRHPAEGVSMLRSAGVSDKAWLDYVLLHHESDDGSGYPEGLHGAAIPLNAKLISLADRYCASVSARNYRRSLPPDRALRALCIDNDVPVDVTLARHFIEKLGQFPPGALVRLKNGECGVVSQIGGGGQLAIHALRGADGAPLVPPAMRSSADSGCAVEESLTEVQLGMHFSMKSVWGDAATVT
jgi:HD-GYP domain-containing protein (c-di-GMP phosphodiesterase class II)